MLLPNCIKMSCNCRRALFSSNIHRLFSNAVNFCKKTSSANKYLTFSREKAEINLTLVNQIVWAPPAVESFFDHWQWVLKIHLVCFAFSHRIQHAHKLGEYYRQHWLTASGQGSGRHMDTRCCLWENWGAKLFMHALLLSISTCNAATSTDFYHLLLIPCGAKTAPNYLSNNFVKLRSILISFGTRVR